MPEPLLPALSPLGLGTPEVESLSSYTQRLAAAQGILPGQLVFRVLTWMDIGRPEMIGEWSRRPRRVRIGSNNNSFSHALVWLRLLQRLTGRADLDQLTTVGWDRNFPTRSFQKSHLTWCPLCLGSDEEPYHPLYWMLQPVTTCLRHRRKLREHCPRCARRVPVVHSRSMVRMCPHCGGNLLADVNGAPAGIPSEYELWAAREITAIISSASAWRSPLHWNPATALKALGKTAGIRDAAAFARFIGTSKITCWYWFTGAARPSLSMVLHTYHRFGSSLVTTLGGRKAGSPTTDAVRQPEIYLRRPRTTRRRNWQLIRRRMLVALRQQPAKAVSLAEFARRNGVHIRTLRVHAPDLCLRVAERYRQRLRQEAEHRRSLLKARVKKALLSLMRRGADVSARAVATELAHPGLFSRPNARRTYQQLLRGGKAAAL